MDARLSFVLFLVSVFIFNVTGLAEQGKYLSTIHVISSMPSNSETIQLRCGSRDTNCGMQQVDAGGNYECGVRGKALYYCMAICGRQMASWHAFQPRRDGNHTDVFWLVKDNGFFHSWDNSTWVRKSKWQYE